MFNDDVVEIDEWEYYSQKYIQNGIHNNRTSYVNYEDVSRKATILWEDVDGEMAWVISSKTLWTGNKLWSFSDVHDPRLSRNWKSLWRAYKDGENINELSIVKLYTLTQGMLVDC